MKKFLLKMVSAAFLMTAVIFSAQAKPNEVDRIVKSGKIIVGVKDDVPKFGMFNKETNQYEGLEIDIAKAIAKKILGNDQHIEFVPVNAKNRGPFLKSDKIDIVLATFTLTEERKNYYEFSDVYYTDPVGIMVKKSSGITTFKDLEGKKIGVAQSSITSTVLKKAAIQESTFIVPVPYASYPILKTALDDGEVDAISVDRSILLGYIDENLVILPQLYEEQHYAAAIKKGNTKLLKIVNEVIRDLVKSGELDKLLEKNKLAL
jgi:putative glutamine transport system substrate-binding protein